jgi:acetyl esterase/lipase
MDPELAAFVPMMSKVDISDVEAARALRTELAAAHPVDPELLARVEVTDRRAGKTQVPVRIYRPKGAVDELPALLWIHGGGFVLGDLETTHFQATLLCMEVGALVVSVGYRLAPEHPFPAAHDDCYGALEWLAGSAGELGVDPGRVAVGGASAGAGLAAGVVLRARDQDGPAVCFQLLEVPVLDDRMNTPSMIAFTDTPGWNRGNAEVSWRYYLGGATEAPGYAAPARAGDLAGLPPTYLSTCELDPLRDEGIEYAWRLLQAGVAVELHQWAGTFHGSRMMPSAISRRQNAETFEVLRRGLETAGVGG